MARICLAGILALLLVTGGAFAADKAAKPAKGEGEKPAVANGNGSGVKPLAHYDPLITKNPFSPTLWRKPEPPKPKVKPKARPKPVKVVHKDDNLTLTGVVWDNDSNRYMAMLDVKGGKAQYLAPGQGYKKVKVESVKINHIEITDHQGKRKRILLGEAFHDGVATRIEWKGGAPPASSSSSGTKPSSSGGSKKSNLSDAKKKEILERLKERRRRMRELREKNKKK